jgi:hypothetical protein
MMLPADVTKHLLELSAQSRQVQVMSVPERQQLLHNLQDKICVLQRQYRDNSLEFKALHLAFESVRLAWYAVGQNPGGCRGHWDDLEPAFTCLGRHLEVSNE